MLRALTLGSTLSISNLTKYIDGLLNYMLESPELGTVTNKLARLGCAEFHSLLGRIQPLFSLENHPQVMNGSSLDCRVTKPRGQEQQ